MFDRISSWIIYRYCKEPMILRLIRQRDRARAAGDILARAVFRTEFGELDEALKNYTDADGIAFPPRN